MHLSTDQTPFIAGRRPRAHISQGCARCTESGPDRLGHSPASRPVASGRTRVGARPPSCGVAVDAPPPPAHGSFERRGARALGGGEGRCVFFGAQLQTRPYLAPGQGRSGFCGRTSPRSWSNGEVWTFRERRPGCPCLFCALTLTCCAPVTCWCRCRRAWERPATSAAFTLDVPGDPRPSLPSRHSVFLLVSVALALACCGEGTQGAAQAPWRYVCGVFGHHRLALTDVLPFGLTVLRTCVRVQDDAGGSWKGDGDDGAHAFPPLSPPPR
jgi:hypothetical protein